MFKSIWRFFSGKKTAIGAALMIAGQFLPPETVPVINEVVTQVGTVAVSVGLIHKAVKSLVERGE